MSHSGCNCPQAVNLIRAHCVCVMTSEVRLPGKIQLPKYLNLFTSLNSSPARKKVLLRANQIV